MKEPKFNLKRLNPNELKGAVYLHQAYMVPCFSQIQFMYADYDGERFSKEILEHVQATTLEALLAEQAVKQDKMDRFLQGKLHVDVERFEVPSYNHFFRTEPKESYSNADIICVDNNHEAFKTAREWYFSKFTEQFMERKATYRNFENPAAFIENFHLKKLKKALSEQKQEEIGGVKEHLLGFCYGAPYFDDVADLCRAETAGTFNPEIFMLLTKRLVALIKSRKEEIAVINEKLKQIGYRTL